MRYRQGAEVLTKSVSVPGDGPLGRGRGRRKPAAAAPQPVRGAWSMQFTAAGKAVALARHQVERTLVGWRLGTPDIERAVLITSELATNAVRHGRVPGRLFEVRLTAEPDGSLLVEVSDADSRAPRPLHATVEDETGRGLALVAALADEVGHRPRRHLGKTVWARFRTGPVCGD